jgi:hypothetical protein
VLGQRGLLAPHRPNLHAEILTISKPAALRIVFSTEST